MKKSNFEKMKEGLLGGQPARPVVRFELPGFPGATVTLELTPGQRAVDRARQGKLVECSKEEYPGVRSALQDFAGQCMDDGDAVRAIIALEEVKRLDALFDYNIFSGGQGTDPIR